MHLFIKSLPGSEIRGVPASEMSEIISLFSNFLIISGIKDFELNLWKGFNLQFMPYLEVNFLLTRVSSQ